MKTATEILTAWKNNEFTMNEVVDAADDHLSAEERKDLARKVSNSKNLRDKNLAARLRKVLSPNVDQKYLSQILGTSTKDPFFSRVENEMTRLCEGFPYVLDRKTFRTLAREAAQVRFLNEDLLTREECLALADRIEAQVPKNDGDRERFDETARKLRARAA